MKIKNKKNFILGIVCICITIFGILAKINQGEDVFNQPFGRIIGYFIWAIIGTILIVKSFKTNKKW